MARNTISQVYMLCSILFLSLTYVVYGDEEHVANVVTYDARTFAEGVLKSRNFVMFYAPWCGHCKSLAPTWDELARVYNSAESSPVVISKVDCTIYTDVCALHNVLGFPTLKLFSHGGSRYLRYKGKRDLESLKKFVQEKIDDTGSEAAETENSDASTLKHEENLADVDKAKIRAVFLTKENFADKIRNGYFFIDFYAPWCGHCKQLAPAWDDLAETFNPQNKVTIAKIDCTEDADICKDYGVKNYPTLLWFKGGEKIEKYGGKRTYEALKTYVSAMLSEDTADRVEEKLPASLKTSKVVELTGETFESHITSSNLVFVKFLAPWCGHCKKLIPVWEEMAEAFQDQPVSIAKLDCTLYSDVCKKYQIRGYPTLKLFHKGDVQDYRGFRHFESMHKFLMKQLEKQKHDEL